MEYSVYKPDQPSKEFLLRIADDGSEEVLPSDKWEVKAEQEVELKEQTQEALNQEESSQEKLRQEESNAKSQDELFQQELIQKETLLSLLTV